MENNPNNQSFKIRENSRILTFFRIRKNLLSEHGRVSAVRLLFIIVYIIVYILI